MQSDSPRVPAEQADAIVQAAQRLIAALGDYFCEWQITEDDLEEANQELLAATNALDALLKAVPCHPDSHQQPE